MWVYNVCDSHEPKDRTPNCECYCGAEQAFAVPAKDAATAPDGYITQLSGGGRTYHVYVHRCAPGN